MATVGVQSQPAMPKRSFKPIIETVSAKRKHGEIEFDPAEHLAFKAPPEIIMMKDIGYAEDTGVSPVAVSQPFQLFSSSAVQQIRDEVLSPDVMSKFEYKSNIAACQIRGYCPQYAPFVYDAWNNAETLSIISQIAGVDLIPNMNIEVGHVNISVKSEEETQAELDAIDREKKSYDADEGIAGCPWEDDKPVVGWHTDSYPFVCVLMLSDCTNMVGGETALHTGNGDIMKVRGPQKGCAVILQGRYITHQALRALGAQERITMVTSFRPRSPYLPDDTVLTTVRPISDLPRLYYEFSEYRLAMLEERVRTQLKLLRGTNAAGKKFNTKALKQFLSEQEAFLKRTNDEIVEDEHVAIGQVEEVNIPNEGTELVQETMQSAKRVQMM